MDVCAARSVEGSDDERPMEWFATKSLKAVAAAKHAPLASAAAAKLAEEEAAMAAKQADEQAVHPDWSSISEDLIATVMDLLNTPDLFNAGAVCTSWCAAYSAVRNIRVPIKDASPFLLYSCAGDDDDSTACVYSPSAGTTFNVCVPAFRRRYMVGSGHGWIVAADEASNLQAFNPLTGAQLDLPPVIELYRVETTHDDQGRPVYNLFEDSRHEYFMDSDAPYLYTQWELRIHLYERVYHSCRPSAGNECILLLFHMPVGTMSFARVGDKSWTHITQSETVPWNQGYSTATYNKKDGLFYIVSSICYILTLDLNGATPIAKRIINLFDANGPTGYVVFAPWGDILHVRRFLEAEKCNTLVQGSADLAYETMDQWLEWYTEEIQLYKVDIHNEKLVKISCLDLRRHSLFLGFNFPMLVSTEDFSKLRPNCVYLTGDNSEHIAVDMFRYREVGIWDFETGKVESLGDVHSTNPWLNFPPPTWFTPSLI